MPDQGRSKRGAPICDRPKVRGVENGGCTGQQHDGIVQRYLATERGRRAENAFAANDRYLDRMPVREADGHRDDAAVRQIDTRLRCAGFNHDSFPDHFGELEMRAQRLEFRRQAAIAAADYERARLRTWDFPIGPKLNRSDGHLHRPSFAKMQPWASVFDCRSR